MLDRSTVERQVLANGLVFLADTAVDNDIVALKLHLRLGSLYEADGEAGLSACMARMLLRGAGARDAAELAMSIESLGVRLHTGVGNENGLLALVCPREVFDRGFEIALEVLTRPVFPEAELAVDIQTTLASIQSRLDHPLAHAVDLFDETYYAQHPFHKPAIGYAESVRALTRAAVVAHWRRFVRPDNMVAVLVGRVEAGAVRARLEAALGKPAAARGITPQDGVEPGQAPAQRVVGRRTQTAWIVAGWPAPPIGHPDTAPMVLLTSILGGSMDSRLFTALRERLGLVYEVGAQLRANAGPSSVLCYAGTAAARYERARAALLAEVMRLRDAGPTTDEVERARSYLRGTHRMAMERNANRASSYGVHELFGLGYDYALRLLAELEAATRDDLVRVAQRWWRQPTLAAVVPEETAGGGDGP